MNDMECERGVVGDSQVQAVIDRLHEEAEAQR